MVMVSLALHGVVGAVLVWRPDLVSSARYDDGSGTGMVTRERGITVEGLSFGDAAERIEVAEVAPSVAAAAAPPEVVPSLEEPLAGLITATESPTEVAATVEDPPPLPPPDPVRPTEVAVEEPPPTPLTPPQTAAVDQAAQVEMFAERDAGQAQDAGRAEEKQRYAGQLNRALGRVRVGRFAGAGEVVIQFELDRAGKVVARSVLSSSGNPALDRLAVDWLDRARFPPLPSGLGERELFTIPMRFERS
jgi:protein TonB